MIYLQERVRGKSHSKWKEQNKQPETAMKIWLFIPIFCKSFLCSKIGQLTSSWRVVQFCPTGFQRLLQWRPNLSLILITWRLLRLFICAHTYARESRIYLPDNLFACSICKSVLFVISLWEKPEPQVQLDLLSIKRNVQHTYVEIKFTFNFWTTTIQLYPSALLLRISCWDSTGQLTCQPSVILAALMCKWIFHPKPSERFLIRWQLWRMRWTVS